MIIYRPTGTKLIDVTPEQGAVVHHELGGEHYVRLPFTLPTAVTFPIGSYVNVKGFGRFEVTEENQPKFNAQTGGYDYDLQLDASYMKWKNKLLRYRPLNAKGSETSFRLTATIGTHLNVVTDNLRRLGEADPSFLYDGKEAYVSALKGVADDAKNRHAFIAYEGTDILSALNRIAEAFGCEWWVEDNVICMGRCEMATDTVVLEMHDAIEQMSTQGSKGVYANRLIVFGSERNLPANYREATSPDIVTDGVVQRRLMLPEKDAPKGYIQAPATTEKNAVEAVVVMEDIYPKVECFVKTLTSYESESYDKEGNKVAETFYRVTDTAFKFTKEMILPDKKLHIVFQSGRMNGMDFEAEYSQKNNWFEIVANDTYGRKLPDKDLHPAPGDKFILYNWDSSKAADTGIIEKAEAKLLEAARKQLDKMQKDGTNYECTLSSYWAEKTFRTSAGEYTHYAVGQPVTLKDEARFPQGRKSRIIGYEIKLDIPYDTPRYIVGESPFQSRTERLQQQIDSLTVGGKTYQGTGGSSSGGGQYIYLITQTSQVAPSDTNVFSAARTELDFVHKKKADTIEAGHTFKAVQQFKEGIEFGTYSLGYTGAFIDGEGNAELLTMIVRQLISSAQYKSGFDGEGYRLWIDKDGLSNLELDKLTVRQIMTVFELIIDRIRAVGGQIVVSAANGKIKSVEDMGESYKIRFEGGNYFEVHDLMRCQVFSGEEAKSYWVEVVESTPEYILVRKNEFQTGVVPKEGDEVVLMGNTTDPKRQNLISISATEDGQPRIDVLDGVKQKSFANALRARLGNLDGITDTSFPLDNQPHGNGLYADNVYLRGSFLLSTGEDVKTRIEAVEGKIETSIDGVRQDFMQDKGFLSNPMFQEGLNHWTTEGATTFFLLGNRWIWANQQPLTHKKDGVSVVTDGNRKVVRIRNKYIKQKLADLRGVPTIKTNKDGKKEPAAVYLSFFFKVKKAGILSIRFDNVDNTGFTEYEQLSVFKKLETTANYEQFTVSGLWNGTGDFTIGFTGEIYLYMLVLSTDRIESLTYTYRTLFEQSEKLVRIAAGNFDKDGNVLAESQIITTAKQNEIFSRYFDEHGNLKNTAGLITTVEWEDLMSSVDQQMQEKMDTVAFAGMFAQAVEDNSNIVKQAEISAFVKKDADGKLESGIYLGADNIKLEGLVTANKKFKILEDGSMEAIAGSIGGWKVNPRYLASPNGSSVFDAVTGNIACSGMMMRRPTVITDDNADSYFVEKESSKRVLSFISAGTLLILRMNRKTPGKKVIVEGQPTYHITFPSSIDSTVTETFLEASQYLGVTIYLFNAVQTPAPIEPTPDERIIPISGRFRMEGQTGIGNTSLKIKYLSSVRLTCVNDGMHILWEYNMQENALGNFDFGNITITPDYRIPGNPMAGIVGNDIIIRPT